MSLEKELTAKAQIARQSSGVTNPIVPRLPVDAATIDCGSSLSQKIFTFWGKAKALLQAPRLILSIQDLLSENHQRILEIRDLKADLHKYTAEIQSLRAIQARPHTSQPNVTSNSISPVWSNYYRAFEDRFRGSGEQITAKQTQYLGIVTSHLRLGAKVADLGCGRGEWLKLAADKGFEVLGIDSNEAMLKQAASIGVPTVQADLFAWLAAQEAGSFDLVSAFHVIEHLTAQQLLQLVAEIIRVLRPGGLVILETPNPENIRVGSCNFWSDITHQKPIPPPTLGFILEFIGFEQIDCVRSGDTGPHDPAVSELFAPPDYAIISRKK